jgi:hypothetical protein
LNRPDYLPAALLQQFFATLADDFVPVNQRELLELF